MSDFTFNHAVVVPVNERSVNVISLLLVVPSSKSAIFRRIAWSVCVTSAHFLCVFENPDVSTP